MGRQWRGGEDDDGGMRNEGTLARTKHHDGMWSDRQSRQWTRPPPSPQTQVRDQGADADGIIYIYVHEKARESRCTLIFTLLVGLALLHGVALRALGFEDLGTLGDVSHYVQVKISKAAISDEAMQGGQTGSQGVDRVSAKTAGIARRLHCTAVWEEGNRDEGQQRETTNHTFSGKFCVSAIRRISRA